MRLASAIFLAFIITIVISGAYYLLSVQASPATAITPAVFPTLTASTTEAVKAPVVGVTSSPAFGDYLVSAGGMTLYVFADDTSGTSSCISATCTTLWPPYLVSSSTPLTESPLAPGVVGTITRPNGGLQVTYNGAPLYLCQEDNGDPGDANGAMASDDWSVARL